MGKGAQRLSVEALNRRALLSTEEAEAVVEKRTSEKHPHSDRRSEILKAHPEVSGLFGVYRGTAVWTLTLVTMQMALSVVLTLKAPWWVALVAMYSVGAVIDHSLWVLIHEATHNLVFKSAALNRVVLLLANIPHVFPSAMMFRYYHILHHIELNRTYDASSSRNTWETPKDPDVPSEFEARLVGNSSVRKSLWLLFFFLVQALRTTFYTHRIPKGMDVAWFAINWAVNLSVNGAIAYFFGWKPLLYLVLSSIFCIGLHPLGARWIQEHYPTQPFQATYSYYGWVNRVAFAIGYHVEHHDFPSVPWNKLATVKAVAPEYYDTLFAYTSYSELLKDFIFNRKWSLKARFEVENMPKVSAELDVFTKTAKKAS